MYLEKKYSVNVHYDVVLSTEVIAESESEAIDLAIEKLTDASLNDGEVVEETGCVTSVEEVKKPNPLADELNQYTRKLYDALAGLVKKYGDRGSLDVFEFCSTTGNTLQNSTIDKILYFPITDDLFVVFNANTNDYCNIKGCYVEDLIPFVTDLQEWLEQNGNPEE